MRVAGTVLDDLGHPVEGAWVGGPCRKTGRRHHYDVWSPIWEAETDARGRFTAEAPLWEFREALGGDPAWVGHLATASARGHPARSASEPDGARERLLRGESVDGLAVVLVRGACIEGVVRNSSGGPVPGAKFWVSWSGVDGGGGCGGWRTDREGRFTWGLDPDEDRAARATAEALGAEAAPVELEGPFPRGGRIPVVLVVSPAEGPPFPEPGPWVVSGWVEDLDGRPVAGAEFGGSMVESDCNGGWERTSGEDGRFEILLEGDLDASAGFEVDGPGLEAAWIPIPSSMAEALRAAGRCDGLRLVLGAPTAVEGRATDADGRPIPDAWASLSGDFPSPNARLYRHTRVDGEGRYRFEDVTPGEEVWLVVKAEGRTPAWIPLGQRTRKGETVTVDAVLPPVREVPLVVTLKGWTPGMQVSVRQVEPTRAVPVEPAEAVVRRTVGTCPGALTVWCAAGHDLSDWIFEVPQESGEVRFEVEVPPCARCAEEREPEDPVPPDPVPPDGAE